MSTMERILFETVKEGRGSYFVRYHPAHPNHPIASLHVVFPKGAKPEHAASTMESEVAAWLERYAVPIMAYDVGPDDDGCGVESVRPADVLTGFKDEGGRTHLRWGVVDSKEMPDADWSARTLRIVYADIPTKSEVELHEIKVQTVQRARMQWAVVFFLTVVVPITIALVEWASNLVGTIVAVVAIWKGVMVGLHASGRLKKSKRQLEREAEKLRRDHHHYHCDANPEAFERLKAENFARWEREKLAAEAAALQAAGSLSLTS